jgi:type VI secretion system secreted protein Hcp
LEQIPPQWGCREIHFHFFHDNNFRKEVKMIQKSFVTIGLWLGMMLLVADAVQADFDGFLQLVGLTGKSNTRVHSANWSTIPGMPSPVSAGSAKGGAQSGRAAQGDFSIVKTLDNVSPVLNQACAKGTHIPEVTLELNRAGRDKQAYCIIKMSNVTVTSVRPQGSSTGGDPAPLEEINFHYGKVEWEYTSTGTTGSGGGSEAQWDTQKDK